MTNASSRQQGYSLLELSVVMVVIGIVVASSLSINSQQVTRHEFRQAQKELQAVNNALKIFSRIHDRLPCPALLTADDTDLTNFGREATDCSDATPPAGLTRVEYPVASGRYVRIGGVPTKALEINKDLAADEWNGRYLYAVDETMIGSITDSTEGVIEIRDGNGTAISTAGAYILVSAGESKKGAVDDVTLTAITACDAAAKDGENCDNDGVFVDQNLNDGGIAANFYDDIILWKTRMNILQDAPTDTGDTSGGGSSSSSSSSVGTCDIYVNYDMDADADEFSWQISDDPLTTVVHADQWTSSHNNATGSFGGYTLQQGTPYILRLYDTDGAGDELDTAGDFVRFRIGDPSTGTLVAEKTGTDAFISCTRNLTLDSSCAPTITDTTMTCTVPATCDIHPRWTTTTDASPNYTWAVKEGTTTLGSGTVSTQASGTQTVSGLTSGITYTYEITDTNGDGLLVGNDFALQDASSSDIGAKVGPGAFGSCTKTFTLDASCNRTDANTTMSCALKSCQIDQAWDFTSATDTPNYMVNLKTGTTTIRTYSINTKTSGSLSVFSLTPNVTYTLEMMDNNSDGFSHASDIFTAATGSPHNDGFASLSGITGAFNVCTKDFSFDYDCSYSGASTMSCTNVTCDVTMDWDTSADTSPNYSWSLKNGGTTLGSGAVTTQTTSSQTISGLSPGTSYTLRVTDANRDGFDTGSVELLDTDGPATIATKTSGVFTTCTKTFTLDAACARTDTDTTMSCTGGTIIFGAPSTYIMTGGADLNARKLLLTDGSIVWSASFPDEVRDIDIDVDGNVYAVSSDENTLPANQILKKFDSDGNLIWTVNPHSTGDVDILGVSWSPDGYVYTCSTDFTLKQLNESDGSTVWTYNSGVECKDVKTDKDGNILLAGYMGVTKIRPDKTVLWNYSGGGAAAEFNIDTDSAGSIYVSSWDKKVIKLNGSTGAVIWSYTTPSTSWGVAAGSNGYVYAVSTDTLYKLNASTGAWVAEMAAVTGDNLRGVEVDSDNNVYVTDFAGNVVKLDANLSAITWQVARHSPSPAKSVSIPKWSYTP